MHAPPIVEYSCHPLVVHSCHPLWHILGMPPSCNPHPAVPRLPPSPPHLHIVGGLSGVVIPHSLLHWVVLHRHLALDATHSTPAADSAPQAVAVLQLSLKGPRSCLAASQKAGGWVGGRLAGASSGCWALDAGGHTCLHAHPAGGGDAAGSVCCDTEPARHSQNRLGELGFTAASHRLQPCRCDTMSRHQHACT